MHARELARKKKKKKPPAGICGWTTKNNADAQDAKGKIKGKKNKR
jgi:hypothetical protein